MLIKLADSDGYLDIIIYALVMVAGLAANAYRNYNKRKEAEQKIPNEPEVDFPDVFMPPVYDYEEPAYSDQDNEMVEKELPKEEILDQVPVEEVSSEKGYIEGEAVFEYTHEAINSDDMLEMAPDMSEDLSKTDFFKQDELTSESEEEGIDFDLREAVIFSEILKAKYI